MTAADQVAVSGLLDTGVFVNAHFRGGMSSAITFIGRSTAMRAISS